MDRKIVKRKFLQKLIKDEYKKFKAHKKIKLSKIFRLDNPDDAGCNWSISIVRETGWEQAADHIRPFIISLRSSYALSEDNHSDKSS